MSKVEKLKPVVQAIKDRTGVDIDPVTAWRWAKKGCGGVRLETLVLGSRRYTTDRAVDEFIEARTQATSSDPTHKAPPSHSETRRIRNAKSAVEDLKKLGV